MLSHTWTKPERRHLQTYDRDTYGAYGGSEDSTDSSSSSGGSGSTGGMDGAGSDKAEIKSGAGAVGVQRWATALAGVVGLVVAAYL